MAFLKMNGMVESSLLRQYLLQSDVVEASKRMSENALWWAASEKK